MRGLLKGKSAGMQFLILISLCLVCFFFGLMIGSAILSPITGVKTADLVDASKLDFSRPAVINYMRGLQIVQFISLFLVPSLLCARLFSTDSKKYLGWKAPGNLFYFGTAAILLFVAIPFCGWLGELNRNIQFPAGIEQWARTHEEDAAKQMGGLLSQHTIKDLVLNLVCVALLAAVGEELLFRSLVQRLLSRVFKNAWVGILAAAFLFSAFHFQFYGFLPRFVLGILLGALYWYSGSIWTAMVAHFVYDAFLIILVYIQPEKMKEDNVVDFANLQLVAAVSLALVVAIMVWMKKRSTVSYATMYAGDSVPAKNHPFEFEENTPV